MKPLVPVRPDEPGFMAKLASRSQDGKVDEDNPLEMGDERWEQWNNGMREYLIGAQSTLGHEKGSWFITGPHVSAGGRLYCTAMATMILEVYYRHMPIYQEEAIRSDFPE